MPVPPHIAFTVFSVASWLRGTAQWPSGRAGLKAAARKSARRFVVNRKMGKFIRPQAVAAAW
jgi:hypothetical protein